MDIEPASFGFGLHCCTESLVQHLPVGREGAEEALASPNCEWMTKTV